MKTLRTIFGIFAAISICQFVHSQTDVSQQPLSTTVPVTPRLAPEGTYFLTGSTSIIKKEKGALIGLHPGTVLKALRDDGRTLHVAWEDSEFDVDKTIVTNDLDIAQA